MSKKRILIVDDDKDLLKALDLRLKANNYDTTFAADGYEATRAARNDSPDLIILDIGLPLGDGFLVMDRMKDFIEVADIPVIILTARDPEANKERSLKAGAFAFFQKPADNDELLASIRKALGEN
ncbi:MAG: response regulator transcription factor [Desulfobacteraceae bacterium]|nr:response regulator transcription factor [Desulfobacteraceae bacterium]